LTRSEFDRVSSTRCSPSRCCAARRPRSPQPGRLRHHERCDGSGYQSPAGADACDPGACVLARPRSTWDDHRAGRPPGVLRGGGRPAEPGAWKSEGVPSHGHPRRARRGRPRSLTARVRKRAQSPPGLSPREVDVLRLATGGFTTREIGRAAGDLIQDRRSPHPAHLHQIGVSTRRRRPSGHSRTSRPQRRPPIELDAAPGHGLCPGSVDRRLHQCSPANTPDHPEAPPERGRVRNRHGASPRSWSSLSAAPST